MSLKNVMEEPNTRERINSEKLIAIKKCLSQGKYKTNEEKLFNLITKKWRISLEMFFLLFPIKSISFMI